MHKKMPIRCGCLCFPHFHSHSCRLMCYLQKGATPVMLAAGKGHTGVVDLLVHKYNCSLTEVATVSAFDVLGCQCPVGVSCQCLCPAVTVECHSACSRHLCRMYVTDILPVPSRVEYCTTKLYSTYI